MNYQKIHDQIINQARCENRKKGGFILYELHHITMQSMGGKTVPENEVLLTLREHFLIHYLLWKMNPTDRRFRDPLFYFKRGGGVNGRMYERSRISHILEMRNNNPSSAPSVGRKISKALKQHVRSDEHKKNISKSRKGVATRTGAVLTQKTKILISKAVKKWHKMIGVSEETRTKISKASTGRLHTPETLQNLRTIALNRKKYRCKSCKKLFDPGNYAKHICKYMEVTQ